MTVMLEWNPEYLVSPWMQVDPNYMCLHTNCDTHGFWGDHYITSQTFMFGEFPLRCGQSDKISHIDIVISHIHTVISHIHTVILRSYFISILSSSISMLSS